MTSWKENYEAWDAEKEASGQNFIEGLFTPYDCGYYNGRYDSDVWWATRVKILFRHSPAWLGGITAEMLTNKCERENTVADLKQRTEEVMAQVEMREKKDD